MRLPYRTEWLLIPHPTGHVERIQEPIVFNLDQAVEWIKKEKPLIWLGSIFSVPEPSGFPSGYALTRSLLELALQDKRIPNINQDLIDTILPRWPLEALLDEFEFLDFDLSESMLSFFKKKNHVAKPNELHRAVVTYYKKGLARRALCVTTNWDTLQEKAFRESGYSTVIAGPGERPAESFGQKGSDPKTVFVYHPHGSFETGDVVCSYSREQRQLALYEEIFIHPTLFLGYSGYEPSIYKRLEFTAGQLWCIRDRSDFEIPAKRRLLSRPNTFVFIGDMRELLGALDVLKGDVDLTSKELHLYDEIPEKIIDVIRLSILSSLNPSLCIDAFANTLMSFHKEPEATIRYITLMRAIVNHTRNRIYHPGLLLSFLSGARFRNTEQTWISLLAYLLRNGKVDANSIEQIFKLANDAAAGVDEEGSPEDQGVYTPGVLLNRTKLYKSFVGIADKIDDERLYIIPALAGSDMAAGGENMELLAFQYLREGKNEPAKNCFDGAATSFYLRGLWRAGKLNEWASSNIDSMVRIAHQNTLWIPDKDIQD